MKGVLIEKAVVYILIVIVTFALGFSFGVSCDGSDVSTNVKTNKTAKTEKPKTEDSRISINETGKMDKVFNCKVTKVRKTLAITSHDGFSSETANDNAKYVIVSVNLKNIGNSNLIFTEDDFVIKCKGKHYSMENDLSVYDNEFAGKVLWSPINPGISIHGNLVFEVPKDAKFNDMAFIVYNPNTFDDKGVEYKLV